LGLFCQHEQHKINNNSDHHQQQQQQKQRPQKQAASMVSATRVDD
jgi:hypothetical protein